MGTLVARWACGLAVKLARRGVHGANRLASNSLLEALVYGSRVAENIAATRTEDGEPHDASSRRRFGPRFRMTKGKRKL